MSFFNHFFDIVDDTKEAAVCCPFDHYTGNNLPYKESNPSAHVNTTEKLFHCKVCQTGYSEVQFIQQLFDCSGIDARKLQRCFETEENTTMWEGDTSLTLKEETRIKALSLGISDQVITALKIKSSPVNDNTLCFPVLIYDSLIDIRKYTQGEKPKVKSRSNCPSGLIMPFDLWRTAPEDKLTLICAGEKDMALARTHGFNAITLTGGEGALCKMAGLLRNRPIAIVYDNDGAGINGAKALATQLLEYTPTVKVVTGFHEICKEPGEDITDFFMKYHKSRADLIAYIKATPEYIPSLEDKAKRHPLVDLLTAAKPEYIGKLLQSSIQVVAVSEASYSTPAAILAEKFKTTEQDNTMQLNETREWELTEETMEDILHFMDNNFSEEQVNKNIKTIIKVPFKERCVKIKQLTKQTVFKASVTDLFETSNSNTLAMEYNAYSIGQKLESGKKYLITYKLVPHPYKGQQLTMIILKATQATDSVSNFKLTPETRKHLQVFRDLQGTVEEKINTMVEKVKGLLGYNGNNTLIQTIDLAYHTVLQFDFGSFKNVRGYLDTIIVGESRVGKSSTAETLRTTYNLGTFTSLAGNSATVQGLIGGSNKTAGGNYQTRSGIIPQNHKGLIIFEEFGKSNDNIIAELTDIRSSNEVRITRVSGTITLPAMVRMIALTNVKNRDGVIKSIASYPHGIAIITELVQAAEDIARYDLITVLSDRGNAQIDPFWEPQKPFDPETYRTRVRWIWSRTPEQIIIPKEIGLYIMEKANELNKIYDCHIKIFGTETWKKLTRLAVAISGYLVSTDDTFTNIVVTKEQVDYAITFMDRLYNNPTFKLKEYVVHEKQYSTIDAEGIANLQDIYNQHPSLILQLEQCSTASRNVLGASSGLGNDDLNKALTRLTKGLFVRFANHDIIPTERFRIGLSKINRNTIVRRVGECSN